MYNFTPLQITTISHISSTKPEETKMYIEEKLKVAKDLLPGSDNSANKFQETIKEQILLHRNRKKNLSTQSIRPVNIYYHNRQRMAQKRRLWTNLNYKF